MLSLLVGGSEEGTLEGSTTAGCSADNFCSDGTWDEMGVLAS